MVLPKKSVPACHYRKIHRRPLPGSIFPHHSKKNFPSAKLLDKNLTQCAVGAVDKMLECHREVTSSYMPRPAVLAEMMEELRLAVTYSLRDPILARWSPQDLILTVSYISVYYGGQ